MDRNGLKIVRENLLWEITIIVFSSEKRKPGAEGHAEILSGVFWRSLAARLFVKLKLIEKYSHL